MDYQGSMKGSVMQADPTIAVSMPASIKWLVAAVVAWWARDVPAMMQTLVLFMCIDYFTGIVAAAMEGRLSSRVGLIGLTQKTAIIGLLLFAHHLEQLVGHEWGAETLGAFGYAANEVISIVENFARIGVPIPAAWITRLLAVKRLVRFDRATAEQLAELSKPKD